MPKAPRLTAPEAVAMLLRAGFVWLRSKGVIESTRLEPEELLFRLYSRICGFE